MNKKSMGIVILLFLSLFCISAVSATENTTDIILTDSNSDFTTLASEINNAQTGDTIELATDYTYTNSDSSYKEGISIAINNLTIDGKGHEIDGSNSARIFKVNCENLTLKNIIFKNGYINEQYGSGAAILMENTNAYIYNCTFADNIAVGTYSRGGAIYSEFLSHITIYGSKFTNNTADYGGAICGFYKDENIISDSIFLDNSEKNGIINIFTAHSIIANYNWWGNTKDNYKTNLIKITKANDNIELVADTWAILDTKSETRFLNEGESSDVTFNFNQAYNENNDEIENYIALDMPEITLSISTENGIANQTRVDIKKGEGIVSFKSNGGDASITGKISGITTSTSFITPEIKYDSFKNLQELIDSSSDIVNIDKNYYYCPEYDFDYTDGVKITKSLTVNGNGYTIDGSNSARIFHIGNNEVTVYNITLKNANYNDYGGAIKNTGKLTIYDSTIVNNTAYASAGIDNEGILNVNNVSFVNNTAYSNDAGAISNINTATIINSVFLGNGAARNGGAVKSNGANTTIKGSYFYYNEAYQISLRSYGGAIYVWKSGADISNCTFGYNSAGDYGGAIYVGGDSNANIYDLQIGANYAYFGGAIYTGTGEIYLDNIEFLSNDGGYGAGLCVDVGSNTYVNNCEFNYNYASGAGGAIYTYGNVTVSNSKFDHSRTEGSSGGAIYVNEVGHATVLNSEFTKNYAYSYGAGIENSGILYVEDSEFEGNTGYGAGAIDNTGYMEIESCIFENNTAYTKDSGAISNMYMASINNSKFINNHAYRNGGAVKNDGSDNTAILFVNNCEFISNTADDESEKSNWGGAIYTWTATTVIFNSTFIDNYATEFGGALFGGGDYYGYSYINVTESLFIDNYAPQGGAIYSGLAYFYANYNVLVGNEADTIYAENYAMGINIENNWWGENEPDWYYVLKFVEIPNSYAQLNISANPTSIDDKTTSVISTGFVWNNQTVDNIEKIPQRKVKLSSTGGNLTRTEGILNGVFESEFGANNGTYTITSTVYNQKVSINITSKSKIATSLTANANVNNTAVTISIEITPKQAIGSVNFTLNNVNYIVSLENGVGSIKLDNLAFGKYKLDLSYGGDENYLASKAIAEFEISDTTPKINLTSFNLIKYFGGLERFEARLSDEDNNPLANETLIFEINNSNYTRITDKDGYASIAINLNSGNYTGKVSFNNTLSSTANISVLSTVEGYDIVKMFRNQTQFKATLTDSKGNPLAEGETVSFNINGVLYNRTADKNGVAQLNINLNPGKYIITTINRKTGEMAANTIIVLSNLIENNNLVKYYRNGSQYTVKVLNDKGYAAVNVNVTFNINGIHYTRTTNGTGHATLNINLQPGRYIITAEYNSCRVSNSIEILPVLSAGNMTMNYGDGSRFEAVLKDGQGNPNPNKTVIFNINGVFYNRTTDDDGIARLNINLMSGEYIITSSFNDANISNTIKIN